LVIFVGFVKFIEGDYMTMKKIILPNNLRVLFLPMKETKAVTLYIVFRVGSCDEPKEQNGISHFIEHLIFKGTKKRPSTLKIAQELDGIGASYNAFTSEEMTGFYIQAERSKFSLILDILYDILRNSLFEQKEIERERGVILEESHMYQDTPTRYIFDLYKRLLYDDTPLGRRVIGEAKTIKALARKQLLDYWSEFYTGTQAVLAVAGCIKEENLAQVKEVFVHLPRGAKKQNYPKPSISNQPQTLVHYKKTDQVHLILGYHSIDHHSPLRHAQEVLSAILGSSMSSRLFIQLREKRGLCYHIFSEGWYFDQAGSLLVYAGVPINRVKEAVSLILAEFNNIKKKGVSQKELERAKEFLKGRLALKLESSYQQAAYYADQELLLGKIDTPEELNRKIEKVTNDEIMELAGKIIKPEGLNLALIGPFKEKKQFDFDKLLKE